MNRINGGVLINAVELMEGKYGLSGFNERFYNQTGVDLSFEIARVATRPDAVTEYDVKLFLKEKLPLIKNCVPEPEQRGIVTSLLWFGESIGIEFTGSKSTNYGECIPHANLDYYDNVRYLGVQYRARYGVFLGDDIGSKS